MSDVAASTPTPAAAAASAAAAPSPTPAAPAAGTPAAAPSPADAAAAAAAAPAPSADADKGGAVDMTGWPAEAVEAIEKANKAAAGYQKEAGNQRINAKKSAAEAATKAAVKAINDTLGIETPDDAPATIEQVTAEVGKTKTELADTKRGAAVTTEAWAQGIDPAKADYLQFKLSKNAEFSAIDMTADDSGDKVRAAVAAQIAADPTLKLTGGAKASGVEELAGGSVTTITPEAWAQMSMAKRAEIYKTDKATYDKLTGNA